MYNDEYLAHFGIKGQKWGIRRFQNEDGTLTEEGKDRYLNKDGTKNYKKINKEAAEDAKEYARAKAYYGDGAGTRRKKIKNLISEKMKDPDYKKEFEKQLSLQDMEKHQKAANRERKVQNAKDKTTRIGRGIKNLILGVGTTSVTAIALYNVAKMTGADQTIKNAGKQALSKALEKVKSMKSGNYGGYNWHPNSNGNAFTEFMNRR